MAGIRYKLPNSDDPDVKINNDNYLDSDYTDTSTKTAVKDDTSKQSQILIESTSVSTTVDYITSDVSGAINNEPSDEVEKKNIEETQKVAKDEQLIAVADTNPQYLEEEGYTPDDISSISTGGSQEIFAEIEYDESGLPFTDLTNTTNSGTSGVSGGVSGIFNSGIEVSGKIPPLTVTSEFCHPTGNIGRFSSKFGLRLLKKKNGKGKWRLHAGIDIGTDGKTPPIYAIYNGEIIKSVTNNSSSYGNYVKIKFDYGGKTFYCIYAHLSSVILPIPNSLGQLLVKKGEAIGRVGGTAGPSKPDGWPVHLHFEITDAKYKWTKLKGKITDTYDGEISSEYDDTQLELAEGGVLVTKPKFDNFIDPADFLNNPNKYLGKGSF